MLFSEEFQAAFFKDSRRRFHKIFEDQVKEVFKEFDRN